MPPVPSWRRTSNLWMRPGSPRRSKITSSSFGRGDCEASLICVCSIALTGTIGSRRVETSAEASSARSFIGVNVSPMSDTCSAGDGRDTRVSSGLRAAWCGPDDMVAPRASSTGAPGLRSTGMGLQAAGSQSAARSCKARETGVRIRPRPSASVLIIVAAIAAPPHTRRAATPRLPARPRLTDTRPGCHRAGRLPAPALSRPARPARRRRRGSPGERSEARAAHAAPRPAQGSTPVRNAVRATARSRRRCRSRGATRVTGARPAVNLAGLQC